MSYVTQRTAASDITRYRFCELDGSQEAKHTDAVGDDVFGVSQEDTSAGDECPLETEGPTKLELDGSGTTINVGDQVMPKGDGTGKGVKQDGTGGNAKSAVLVSAKDGKVDSDGEIATVRLLADRSRTA